jgi:hypothetical protein
VFPDPPAADIEIQIAEFRTKIESAEGGHPMPLVQEIKSVGFASRLLTTWLDTLSETLIPADCHNDCCILGKKIGRSAFEKKDKLDDFIQAVGAMVHSMTWPKAHKPMLAELVRFSRSVYCDHDPPLVAAAKKVPTITSEKDAKLAQKLGQLQPFAAVFPQECMGQLASFGPT